MTDDRGVGEPAPLSVLVAGLAASGVPQALDAAVDPDRVYERFAEWTSSRGLPLYPAQDEAMIRIVSGEHLILSTPTGSGKSLVAVGAHLWALAQGRRTAYTATLKALVNEKFFALVELFGAASVGMITGDSAVNPDAPIICCTAEVLANRAIRDGEHTPFDVVVMDEFHFYDDPDRGWAWQVPLLTIPRAQFVLMSATLGDVTELAADLSRRTGRPAGAVTGVERPVPLHHSYAITPIVETIEQLLETHRAPVYVVHFSQAAAVERAQALLSVRLISREQRDAIAAELGAFRFTTGFGRVLSRLVRSGIGVHHAGMLPRYRRLVEQLAQRGFLRVICGTDTLGVGINVPIRTVLLTALTKFDGSRMRRLTAREFHQIAGRAGRAGYDTAGDVVVQAPEHESENAKAVQKAGDDPKKLRRIVRKKPPEGFVTWGEPTMQRLIDAEPEPLRGRMRVSAAMIVNVIAGRRDPIPTLRSLLFDNHEPRARQFDLARRALQIGRTLQQAGIIVTGPDGVRLTVELQADFALNQPLSPFALAAIELLDTESPEHTLDVVSIIEATLDDPRPVLIQQRKTARTAAIAAMKAEGIEYEQRMQLLDEITHPKPLDELIDHAYGVFASSQPWGLDFAPSPKSVVREMVELAMGFSEYVSHHGLARAEGVVLRYLSDAYRALRQTVPEEAKTEELRELVEWLGEMIRHIDSSLLDEWAALVAPVRADEPLVPPAPPRLSANRTAFRVMVRNELFRRVQLAAHERYDELGELDGADGWGADAWADAFAGYWDEHDHIATDADARSHRMLLIEEGPDRWRLWQILADPAGDHDWGIEAEVDLGASDAAEAPVLRIVAVRRR